MRLRSAVRRTAGWRGLVACAAFFLVAAPASGQTPGDTLVIQAGAWVAPDGKLTPGGLVVVRDGKIAQVGGAAPAGATVVEFADGVLSPGLIDVCSSLSAAGQLSDTALPLQPEARAADAFDRYRDELARARAAGVTAFGLAPGEQNVVGGRIAVCRTGTAHAGAEVLEANGPLRLSVGPAVFRNDREPTSRSGAVGLLRRALAAAEGAAGSADLAALRSGKANGVWDAPSAADVSAVLTLQAEFGLRLAVQHELDADKLAGDLHAAGAWAIVGPLDFQSEPRRVLAGGRYESAGVAVAVAGGLPQHAPDSLRIGAALAVRGGLSPEAGRRAITGVPAEILGVAGQVGALEAGRRADVVVFSGDPLDLRARVLAVFVDGRRVSESNPAH